jgi:acyl-coenzyme A synthetase/AMP-(fatty) acid ligase
MKKVILDVINENAPDGQKYYTLEELKEETNKLGEKLNANELDKNNRVNACNLIMDSEALGFLLLAYMKGGSVQMSSNMQDDKMTDRVLTVLKEMLYSDNHKLRKL